MHASALYIKVLYGAFYTRTYTEADTNYPSLHCIKMISILMDLVSKILYNVLSGIHLAEFITDLQLIIIII